MPTGVPGSSALTWPDYAVLSLVLACLIAIGVRFTREQRDTVDFFLARRRVPWWAPLPVVPRHRDQRRHDHLGAGHRLQRELAVLPVLRGLEPGQVRRGVPLHPRSEEHTSELQSQSN